MSLINNAGKGSQIELMCIIYRMLSRSEKPVEENKLMSFGRPESLPTNDDQAKRFPGELNFWAKTNHQLWERSSDNEYKLVVKCNDRNSTPESIASVVREVLFEMGIDSVINLKEGNDGVDHLFCALSCILALPNYSFAEQEVLDNNALREIFSKHMPSGCQLNNAELAVTLDYGCFLGFLEPINNSGFVVDPTRVVTEMLPNILKPGEVTKLDDFIDRLSEKLPVFDRGKYRREVEGCMQERDFKLPATNKLSRALSQALYRIRISGLAEIKLLSDDTQQIVFDLPIGEKPFSTIQLIDRRG